MRDVLEITEPKAIVIATVLADVVWEDFIRGTSTIDEYNLAQDRLNLITDLTARFQET